MMGIPLPDKPPEVIIREATNLDFPKVARLGIDFFEVSMYRSWTFDFGVAHQTMRNVFEHPDVVILVNDDVTGMMIFDIQQLWTIEKIGLFFMLWGKNANELVAKMLEICKERGVRGVFANNVSGMSKVHIRAFRILLLRHGFEDINGSMYKEL